MTTSRKKGHKPVFNQWGTPEQRLVGCEMPQRVQKQVEKMQEDLIAFYLVKRNKFADKIGLPKSDPIRFSIRETFCCRCGYFWLKRTGKPKKCPLCRSKYWQTARTNRQGLRPEVQTKEAAPGQDRGLFNPTKKELT